MAIYGHETSYGTVTGGFDLLEALATLAYEGRRRQLFEFEFVAALQLLDRGTPEADSKAVGPGRPAILNSCHRPYFASRPTAMATG